MVANSYQLHGIPHRIFGHVAMKRSCPDVAIGYSHRAGPRSSPESLSLRARKRGRARALIASPARLRCGFLDITRLAADGRAELRRGRRLIVSRATARSSSSKKFRQENSTISRKLKRNGRRPRNRAFQIPCDIMFRAK
jgi:hypothetical protein